MRSKGRKKEISLAKIMVAIVLGTAIVLGVLRFSNWFNHEFIGGAVEASAATNIEKARQLADSGEADQARALLRPIVARVDNPAVTPKALMLLAEIDRKSGQTDTALDLLRQAAEDYPDSSHHPVAAVAYARLLEDTGQAEKALQIYTDVKNSAPPELRAPAVSGLARKHERDGNILEARDLYRQAAREAKWGSEAWEEAGLGLGRLNVQLTMSPAPTAESKIYRVVPGDSLSRIGTKLNTTQGMLLTANNLSDNHTLHPGQRLKYTPKDFHIVIERSTCRLFLMDNDGLFKMYSVGLGKSGQDTTLGRYKIGNKEKDPTWFKPGSGGIPPGDPRNELGSRWMPLVPEAESLPTDLGIHGTIAPDTVGVYSSMGCPRLLNEEVEELYDLVVRSTPVTIVDTFSPDGSA